MRRTCFTLGLFVILHAWTDAAKPPVVLDKNYTLERFASEPSIVTPVGLTFDNKGRLLVIESHTHFRPKDYQGPKADRIRIVEDTAGDGKADRFTTFYEGSVHTMSIAGHPTGYVYVATRKKIFRLRDTNADGKADVEETLVELKTPGNYPHNGLCGLAFDNENGMYFGLGENLGEPYKLVGADGKTLSGGGEGGNIYHCSLDGKNVMHFATGLWNPFGICVDKYDRVFTVENDPDSRPPCRLLHVVGGADFGFQFRYGRSGLHPLQAWDGELPGTLPMVAGTGEAPCTVLPYRGDLWVTSWGDYRLARYRLKPRGGSWSATMETVVRGDNHFRPVGMAIAPDGSLYFSDWVERSYPLHGKGRIWRLSPKRNAKPNVYPELTTPEKQARLFASRVDLEGLASSDPFLWQAAVWGVIRHGKAAELGWDKLDARQRLGVLQALRWKHKGDHPILAKALIDKDADVRLLAVRWVADARLVKYRPQIVAQLSRPGTFGLYRAAITALPWLDRKEAIVRKEHASKLYASLLDDAKLPGEVRVWALRSLSPEDPALSVDRLRGYLQSENRELAREALWALLLSNKPERFGILAKIANDTSKPDALRADAVMGLAQDVAKNKPLLAKLTESDNESVREEAVRSLRGNAVPTEKQPNLEDTDAWLQRLDAKGDSSAGRRHFFGSVGVQCARCHTFQGRGADLGPDLTYVGRQSKRRVLESILQPSREVAPHYKAWVVETTDGRVLVGYSLGKSNQGDIERLVDANGKIINIKVQDIETQIAAPKSIMPEDLVKKMTIRELRDLLAFLMNDG